MTQPFPVRAVAGCFALAAFAIAIIAGLAAGRSTDAILGSALVAMVIGQIVGYAGGLVISHALLENFRNYTALHTTPTPSDGEATGGAGQT